MKEKIISLAYVVMGLAIMYVTVNHPALDELRYQFAKTLPTIPEYVQAFYMLGFGTTILGFVMFFIWKPKAKS